ncbi:cation-translocating P-type ATPase [Methanosalsum natronophilum]|uniref:cation-translocating P-type ATPase n=1 Tax=Methanosalsum natronophilum TaxID=768733 RepID=UPI002166F0AC|nr:HAD-IC family P-type ATPase [Methanosalsum natronophilum]MCS3924623.1 P-type E1-E2 ATPase [Methanosalsum natronophilum]
MDKKYFWYQLETDEVFNRLSSSTHGLAESRALEDLKQEGPNEIESKQKEGFFKKFFKQFASPLIYILLAAAIITFFLEEYIDSVVILGVVLANAVLGFAQEKKAENALQALSNMIVPETKVIRDNTKKTISSRDLVPGDVVLLESGDRVPADLRLFYVKNMTCDEAPLTGESIPVDKSSLPLEERYLTASDQKNMAFAGTYVTQGIGKGIVVSTGKYTEIGKISESIRESKEIKTPLIKKIEYFGILLSIAILAAAIFTFVVGLLRGLDILETFLASVSLAVAAIPEGLPATLTITLALGVKAMASRNAIIRSMPSVETLGSATVICSDKTGTLTKNQMTVTQIYTSDGNTFET